MPTDLTPKSTTSAIILPATGNLADGSGDDVKDGVVFGMYTGSYDFISGASDQVSYVYRKLGGDVVDIELTVSNVYAAYEEAVLEYSYIFNLHQGKNVLSNVLGETTGAFDHNGQFVGGDGLSGSYVQLRYPRHTLGYSRRVGDAAAEVGGFGGTLRQYSASFAPSTAKQDYDLQSIVETASDSGVDTAGNAVDYAGKVSDSRIFVTQVFYKSPASIWRFYGYYGGIGTVGNYSTYGQYADDSTFEVVPAWQNKMQAIMYEDSLFTRTSHYSFEIINNRLRLYPDPSYWDYGGLDRVWFRFYIDTDPWEENDDYRSGVKGINNLNTLPFDNIPYDRINAIGKQWIRKYALALCKEMLGQIRGKFTTIPIPGESVTLNHSELLSQAKEEQTQLRDKLMEILKETEYVALAKQDQEIADASANVIKITPLPIFVG
jgi:hypothetical protein